MKNFICVLLHQQMQKNETKNEKIGWVYCIHCIMLYWNWSNYIIIKSISFIITLSKQKNRFIWTHEVVNEWEALKSVSFFYFNDAEIYPFKLAETWIIFKFYVWIMVKDHNLKKRTFVLSNSYCGRRYNPFFSDDRLCRYIYGFNQSILLRYNHVLWE